MRLAWQTHFLFYCLLADLELLWITRLASTSAAVHVFVFLRGETFSLFYTILPCSNLQSHVCLFYFDDCGSLPLGLFFGVRWEILGGVWAATRRAGSLLFVCFFFAFRLVYIYHVAPTALVRCERCERCFHAAEMTVVESSHHREILMCITSLVVDISVSHSVDEASMV